MLRPTLGYVLDRLAEEGHTVFERDDREFNLNLVGVRNPNADPADDAYGCYHTAFWKYRGDWEFRSWEATTWPGRRYLLHPINGKGCAILKPGQYRGCYGLSLHRGSYQALCQVNGPVTVYRDNDRDSRFDLDPATLDPGWHGINLHAPVGPLDNWRSYAAQKINGSSAGCQVFRRVADFLEARELWRAAMIRFGNRFTYTLIEGRW